MSSTWWRDSLQQVEGFNYDDEFRGYFVSYLIFTIRMYPIDVMNIIKAIYSIDVNDIMTAMSTTKGRNFIKIMNSFQLMNFIKVLDFIKVIDILFINIIRFIKEWNSSRKRISSRPWIQFEVIYHIKVINVMNVSKWYTLASWIISSRRSILSWWRIWKLLDKNFHPAE